MTAPDLQDFVASNRTRKPSRSPMTPSQNDVGRTGPVHGGATGTVSGRVLVAWSSPLPGSMTCAPGPASDLIHRRFARDPANAPRTSVRPSIDGSDSGLNPRQKGRDQGEFETDWKKIEDRSIVQTVTWMEIITLRRLP
jgi:hypothetical protein